MADLGGAVAAGDGDGKPGPGPQRLGSTTSSGSGAGAVPATVLRQMSEDVPTDPSGTMSRAELEAFLQSEMGVDDADGRREMLEALIEKLDPDGTGRIFLPEFVLNAVVGGTGPPAEADPRPFSPSRQQASHLVQLLTDPTLQAGRDPNAIAEESFDLLDVDGNGVLREDEIALLFAYSGAQDAKERNAAAGKVLSALRRDRESFDQAAGLSRGDFVLGLVSGKLGAIIADAFDGLAQHRPVQLAEDAKLESVLDLFAEADKAAQGQINQEQFRAILEDASGSIVNLAGVSNVVDATTLAAKVFQWLDENRDGYLQFDEFKETVSVLFQDDGTYTGVSGLPKAEIDALEDMVLELRDRVSDLEREVVFNAAQLKTARKESEEAMQQCEDEMAAREDQLVGERRALKAELRAVKHELAAARQKQAATAGDADGGPAGRVAELMSELDAEHRLYEIERSKAAGLESRVELMREAQLDEASALAAEADALREKLATLSRREKVVRAESLERLDDHDHEDSPDEDLPEVIQRLESESAELKADLDQVVKRQNTLVSVVEEVDDSDDDDRRPSHQSIQLSGARAPALRAGRASCRILGHQLVHDARRTAVYTVYTLEVAVAGAGGIPDMTWMVERRYREFDRLHQQLRRAKGPHGKVLKLPPKRFVNVPSHDSTDPEYVAWRKDRLQAYLDVVCAVPALKSQPSVGWFLATTPDSVQAMEVAMKRRLRQKWVPDSPATVRVAARAPVPAALPRRVGAAGSAAHS